MSEVQASLIDTQTPVVIRADNQLTIYAPILQQLAEISELNNSLVFDYSSKKGEKEARSHVYKLKRFKTQAETVRKAATAEARAYTDLVNKTGKSVLEKIEQMIAVHMAPIEAKEAREAERRRNIESEIQRIRDLFIDDFMTSQQAKEALQKANNLVIDESFYQEYSQTANQSKADVILKLQSHIETAIAREKAAEEAFKAKEAARIAAIELQAQKDAQAKAQAAIDEAKRNEALALEKANQAIREAELAKQKAEQALEAEKQKQLMIEQKRAQDIEHRRKVNWSAVNALVCEVPMSEDMAKEVVKCIIGNKIPNVSLKY